MSNAPIYKDSMGNWVCKTCNKSHTTFANAMRCAEDHGESGDESFYASAKEKPVVAILNVQDKMDLYRELAVSKGTLPVAESLVMSIIEDYESVKQHDISEKGRPGALTMSYAKIAIEAINNHNRLVYGTKTSSVNVNVDASKKSDLEALKETIEGKKNEKYIENDS